MTTTTAERGATRGVRNWSDAITLGAVRLHLIGAGRLIGWRLAGPVLGLSAADRLAVAFAWWQRVMMGRGTVWEALAVLFPVADGGTRRGGPRDGVVYVHHE